MSESKQEEINKTGKKLFNKKKWREQKYSHKAKGEMSREIPEEIHIRHCMLYEYRKVEKWENWKRKQVQRQYQKEFKTSNFKLRNGDELHGKESCNSFKQAQSQYKAIQQQKEEKRKEQERIRKEKIEAIKAYKEKKAARFRKLSQKTRKGQPLMRGRIELLLEKIRKEYANCDS